jgi:hypothetical protein
MQSRQLPELTRPGRQWVACPTRVSDRDSHAHLRAVCAQAIKTLTYGQTPVQDQHRVVRRRRDSPGAHLGCHRVPQRGRLADLWIQPEVGYPRVWNMWIIYPFVALALTTAGHGWFVYGRKPIPVSKIKREIRDGR